MSYAQVSRTCGSRFMQTDLEERLFEVAVVIGRFFHGGDVDIINIACYAYHIYILCFLNAGDLDPMPSK